MEYSITFLARGVCGSLPSVTMSGPDWTSFSTSSRILRRSMSRFLRTLAATPEPSLTSPRRMCSVPMYSWLRRWASWLASCITLRARSVKRSYIACHLRQPPAAPASRLGRCITGEPLIIPIDVLRSGSLLCQVPPHEEGTDPVETLPADRPDDSPAESGVGREGPVRAHRTSRSNRFGLL